jgi:3-dehydroquinate synthase
MSDAAIGGKTGINLDNIKNQVGSFQNPEAVFIYPGFLKSLDTYHLLSGLAEIVKTALVADPVLWERLLAVSLHELMDIPFDEPLWEDLLGRSVENKCRIAEMDFRDRNIRGILNFGHTIGHAFESLSLSAKGTPLSHGHAIALGILCESRLSTKKTGLSAKDMEAISRLVLGEFEYIPLKGKDIAYMVSCMGHDKKMKGREIRMTLLEKPGKAVTGVKCDESEIREALDYYGSIKC